MWFCASLHGFFGKRQTIGLGFTLVAARNLIGGVDASAKCDEESLEKLMDIPDLIFGILLIIIFFLKFNVRNDLFVAANCYLLYFSFKGNLHNQELMLGGQEERPVPLKMISHESLC